MSEATTAILKIVWGAAMLAGLVAFNVWATKNNSPQHVWLFCDQLGWCAKPVPYCPPDPRECS